MAEIFSRIKLNARQVAAVVVFVIVSAVAQMAIPSLLGAMIDIGVAACGRIFALLDAEEEIPDPAGRGRFPRRATAPWSSGTCASATRRRSR